MRQRQIVTLGVLAAIVATAGLAPPATAQDGRSNHSRRTVMSHSATPVLVSPAR